MATAKLSNEQLLALVRQLPPERRVWLLEHLLREEWPAWMELVSYGMERARAVAAARGLNWDQMSESEREAFVDAILHEGD